MTKPTTLSFEQIEAIALALPQVVGVSDGESADGSNIVRILIDCPIQKFKLPQALIASDIVLDYVGDIRAQ